MWTLMGVPLWIGFRVSSSTNASPIDCVIQAMDAALTLEATLNLEQQYVQFDDLAQVLHNANLRRSADFGLWLRQYLRRQREINTLEAAANLRNKVVSIIAPHRHRAV